MTIKVRTEINWFISVLNHSLIVLVPLYRFGCLGSCLTGQLCNLSRTRRGDDKQTLSYLTLFQAQNLTEQLLIGKACTFTSKMSHADIRKETGLKSNMQQGFFMSRTIYGSNKDRHFLKPQRLNRNIFTKSVLFRFFVFFFRN